MFQEPDKDNLHKPHKWNNKMWHWYGKKTGGKCENIANMTLPIVVENLNSTRKGKLNLTKRTKNGHP